MFKFENLEVWKRSARLYEGLSRAADGIEKKDPYSLGEQLRRATLSISANIAEGTGREGDRETKQFFNIAKGSVYEVVSLLFIMKEKGYLKLAEYDAFYSECDEIAMMLSGLLRR